MHAGDKKWAPPIANAAVVSGLFMLLFLVESFCVALALYVNTDSMVMFNKCAVTEACTLKGLCFHGTWNLIGGDLVFISVLGYNYDHYRENKIQIIQAGVKEYFFENCCLNNKRKRVSHS